MVGVGLRSAHFPRLLDGPLNTPVQWFEAITENYMDSFGRPLEVLRIVQLRSTVSHSPSAGSRGREAAI
jgi:uncharacterized protein (UPF0276 family)